MPKICTKSKKPVLTMAERYDIADAKEAEKQHAKTIKPVVSKKPVLTMAERYDIADAKEAKKFKPIKHTQDDSDTD
jgi:hypothetical protein